jgi:hypothetical protein
MKKNYLVNRLIKSVRINANKICFYSLLVVGSCTQLVNGQTITYSFTTAGALGRLGPTQGQINAAYAATNLSGSVNVIGQGVQEFTIPSSGPYMIVAAGSSGGGTINSFGCRGRIVQGQTNFTAGQVLRIIVGQKGEQPSGSSGGGGGSFVASGGSPILVAGGGGGFLGTLTAAIPVSDGSYSNAGQNSGCASGTGGVGGSGGTGSNNGWGGGGGGFNTDGTSAINCSTTNGLSFLNGGLGGQTCNNTNGGFGGGAGTHGNTGGGGGGGGYSGGGGSNQNIANNAGGGGGSYQMAGMTNMADLGFNTGVGYVTITKMCSITSTTSANTICLGSSVTLTTDAVSGITWSNGGTGASIVVSPTVTTTYSVQGTSSTSCLGSSAITVSVNIPTVSASSSINYTVCPGTLVTLSGSGTNSYAWSGGITNGVAFPAPNATTVYTVTGTNSVTGCTNTKTISVAVFPTAFSVSSSTTTICNGASAVLTASGASTYSWIPNNSPFASTPVNPNVSTVYTVNAITVNNCSVSGTIAITVNPSPTVSALANQNTICKGESANLTANGATTYSWSNAATSASISVSPTITSMYSVNGVSNGCSSNTATLAVIVNFCTGINQVNGLTQNIFSIYPNPSNGNFVVKSTEPVSLSLINELGEVIKVIALASSNNYSVSLSDVSDGIYFLIGNTSSGNVSQKIVVQK